MIFQHTWEKVLSGEQTEKRQLVQRFEGATMSKIGGPIVVTDKHGRIKYAAGQIHLVQPAANKKSVARICILKVGRDDVRDISDEEAKAEGFNSRLDFLSSWVAKHDGGANFTYYGLDDKPLKVFKQWRGVRLRWVETDEEGILHHLKRRDDRKYMAWVLTFKLVQP